MDSHLYCSMCGCSLSMCDCYSEYVDDEEEEQEVCETLAKDDCDCSVARAIACLDLLKKKGKTVEIAGGVPDMMTVMEYRQILSLFKSEVLGSKN